MGSPFASVIIPAYNCEKCIGHCLDSLLYQGINDFEIIVIDDGSTDNTYFEAEYALRKFSIPNCIISQRNQGVSSARNKGIMESSGRYLIFVDGDDTLHPDALATLYRIACETSADFVYGGFTRVTQSGKSPPTCEEYRYPYCTGTGYDIAHAILGRSLVIRMGTFIVSSQIVHMFNILFEESCHYGEDDEFVIKCLINTKNVACVWREVYNYHINAYSAMNRVSLNRLDIFKTAKRLDACFRKLGREGEILTNALFGSYIPAAFIMHLEALARRGIPGDEIISYLENNKYDFDMYLKPECFSDKCLEKKINAWKKNPDKFCRNTYRNNSLKSFSKKIPLIYNFMRNSKKYISSNKKNFIQIYEKR